MPCIDERTARAVDFRSALIISVSSGTPLRRCRPGLSNVRPDGQIAHRAAGC